jgi:hypothetical protein
MTGTEARVSAMRRLYFALCLAVAWAQGSCAGSLEDRECLLILRDEGSIVVLDDETSMDICDAKLATARGGLVVELHTTVPNSRSTCPYVGFKAIEKDLTETTGWLVSASAPGFEDIVVPVTVPYDAPSCQVHDVDAVIRMKKR